MFEIKYFSDDIIGRKFGRLVIISECEKNKHGKRQVIAECICGNKSNKKYLLTNLITGRIKSCGCICKELNKKRSKHGLKNHKLYQVWVEMRQRCNNPNHKQYKDWGGRGISICKNWDEFINFYEWAQDNGWEEGLQIDRINNNGDYKPSNCRFVDQFVNNQNKRILRISNTSGYANVFKRKDCSKYYSKIWFNRKLIFQKTGFKTTEEAALARDIFCIKNNIPYALNFPELAFGWCL